MSVPCRRSQAPYVLALDIGSTASRGGLYDALGRPVKGSKQRIPHHFDTNAHGRSTIDADAVVDECRRIIDGVLECIREHDLAPQLVGVAMDTFASSFLLVRRGEALTPCATYADARCAADVHALRGTIDEEAYHVRTGVRLHTSYHPARLRWAARTMPEEFAAADAVMTLGEYVYAKLAGVRGISTSMAAWSGILHAHTGELDTAILDVLGVSPELFAPICDPSEPLLPTKLPAEWSELEGLPWLPAIPDGWPSTVGPGASDEDTVAVAAATSGAVRVLLPHVPERIPGGLWCYRVSREQCIVGGALNDVGRAVSWLRSTIREIPEEEIAAALLAPPRPATPHVLPFLSGERSTGWAADAQAAITGVTEACGPADLWRGMVEGIVLSYRRVWEELRAAGARPRRIIASGRVTSEMPAWLQPLASALGCEVTPLEMKRATLRGTALIALDALGHCATPATPPWAEAIAPRTEEQEYWDRAAEEFQRSYDALVAPASTASQPAAPSASPAASSPGAPEPR
ncbi:gluconokinase [Corynebacterium uropygiale]|uniref:Gluconokinase n=1 Tax=Corynebacterium uropygiale TaxID=1775911 RepID=A0A9X1QQ94_9CORY|nr:gluconokinase [Corynebacterium uropygiale]MCF4007662.1 gluconokinase [Corynebacterium uropygiale]